MRQVARRHRRGMDEGSAVVAFVLVMPLLAAVALGVLQLALHAYVRASLVSAAAQGARAAALAGSDAGAGERRVRDLVRGSLAETAIDDISIRVAAADGVPVIEVSITGTSPGLGLLGSRSFEVTGHAVQEGWS